MDRESYPERFEKITELIKTKKVNIGNSNYYSEINSFEVEKEHLVKKRDAFSSVRPVYNLPKFKFFTKKSVCINFVTILTGLILYYFGYSIYEIGIVFFMFILSTFIVCFFRASNRGNRYMAYIKQFGVAYNYDKSGFEQALVGPIPFENTHQIVILFIKKQQIVFGRKKVYREIKVSDIEEINGFSWLGCSVTQVKLIDRDWKDELYLPIDINTFLNVIKPVVEVDD